ncbi:MAG: hypothetical protein HY094_07735 [Candidatus Melainabacteria bacterium]|nr:hypothetical protein [Candidatus Melainabacteria bacterium]
MIRIIVFIILLLFCINTVSAITEYEQNLKQSQKTYLNYFDLVQLSKTSNPQGELLQKLEQQLNLPIIYQPLQLLVSFLHDDTLGDYFRVASWNIERGFNVDRIIQIPEYSFDSKTSEKLKEELEVFSKASIIILNEVDLGMPRTAYKNIAEEIARVFKMGYIFGTEFIEVDPYQLGVNKFSKEEKLFLEDKALKELDNIDKNKYRGLHGTAILSKYPILNAKIIRLPVCYEWYRAESDKLSALEFVRRKTAQQIFSEKILTELRHGNRMAIVADLLLPNNQIITVVATHLENRCVPKCRCKQFEFLLSRLRNIKNPLILAGDFNTTGTDTSPVSVKKEILKLAKDPDFVLNNIIFTITPLTLAQNVVLNTTNFLKQYKDPTTKHIPILFPNKERELFDLLKEFRFNDGGAFDLRGTSGKTYRGHDGLLSNSNERDVKGFKSTFELERYFGIARYKLDWFFIKPLNLKTPNDKNSSYAYAPYYGKTLQELNRSFGEISDHDPIIVDIPAGEPLR